MTYSVRNPDRLGAGATIPPIVHPMGKHWDQPDRSKIVIDAKTAVMDRATFDALHEYSTSYPSGVYEGKMWKAQKWVWVGTPLAIERNYAVRKFLGEWFLRWYGPSARPGYVSTNQREIIIA